MKFSFINLPSYLKLPLARWPSSEEMKSSSPLLPEDSEFIFCNGVVDRSFPYGFFQLRLWNPRVSDIIILSWQSSFQKFSFLHNSPLSVEKCHINNGIKLLHVFSIKKEDLAESSRFFRSFFTPYVILFSSYFIWSAIFLANFSIFLILLLIFRRITYPSHKSIMYIIFNWNWVFSKCHRKRTVSLKTMSKTFKFTTTVTNGAYLSVYDFTVKYIVPTRFSSTHSPFTNLFDMLFTRSNVRVRWKDV